MKEGETVGLFDIPGVLEAFATNGVAAEATIDFACGTNSILGMMLGKGCVQRVDFGREQRCGAMAVGVHNVPAHEERSNIKGSSCRLPHNNNNNKIKI